MGWASCYPQSCCKPGPGLILQDSAQGPKPTTPYIYRQILHTVVIHSVLSLSLAPWLMVSFSCILSALTTTIGEDAMDSVILLSSFGMESIRLNERIFLFTSFSHGRRSASDRLSSESQSQAADLSCRQTHPSEAAPPGFTRFCSLFTSIYTNLDFLFVRMSE